MLCKYIKKIKRAPQTGIAINKVEGGIRRVNPRIIQGPCHMISNDKNVRFFALQKCRQFGLKIVFTKKMTEKNDLIRAKFTEVEGGQLVTNMKLDRVAGNYCAD